MLSSCLIALLSLASGPGPDAAESDNGQCAGADQYCRRGVPAHHAGSARRSSASKRRTRRRWSSRSSLPSAIRRQRTRPGFWTATTEPLVPGFHYYRVFIDGAEVNDPSSETFFGTGQARKRHRDPRKGRGLLPAEGRAARRRARALVSLQHDRRVAARLCLYPARIRHGP